MGGGAVDPEDARASLAGDRVGLEPGAVGDVDDVQVGANSVVVKDVPPGAVVVGVPGQVRRPPSSEPADPYDVWADPAIYI